MAGPEPGLPRGSRNPPSPAACPSRGQVVHGPDQQIIGLSQLGLQPAGLPAAALRPRGGARRQGRRGPSLRLRPLRLGRGPGAAGQVLVVVGVVVVLVLRLLSAALGTRPGVQRGAKELAAPGGGLLPGVRPRPERPQPLPEPLGDPRLRRRPELVQARPRSPWVRAWQ